MLQRLRPVDRPSGVQTFDVQTTIHIPVVRKDPSDLTASELLPTTTLDLDTGYLQLCDFPSATVDHRTCGSPNRPSI
jgi:hypothetical protein